RAEPTSFTKRSAQSTTDDGASAGMDAANFSPTHSTEVAFILKDLLKALFYYARESWHRHTDRPLRTLSLKRLASRRPCSIVRLTPSRQTNRAKSFLHLI